MFVSYRAVGTVDPTVPYCQLKSEQGELAVRLCGLLPCGQMKQPPSGQAFTELLSALVRRFGSRDALGKQIGMSGSRVGRAIDGQYAFNITNCLKLAEATGESPSVVLRAAGKHDVAELIERLYGHSRPAISANDRELIAEWSALAPRDRETVRELLHRLAPGERHRRATAADQKKGR